MTTPYRRSLRRSHGQALEDLGAPSIAKVIGTSTDKVYQLAGEPDCHIYRPPGSHSYFALRAELKA